MAFDIYLWHTIFKVPYTEYFHLVLFVFQIFDLLKATIIKSFKDSDKQKQSSWVREIFPEPCAVQDNVLSTIQNRYLYLVTKHHNHLSLMKFLTPDVQKYH